VEVFDSIFCEAENPIFPVLRKKMKRILCNSPYGARRRKRFRCSFASKRASIRKNAKVSDKTLFISRKRSTEDFVLVRILGATHFYVIRCLAVEGQILQLDLRLLQNKWELDVLKKDRKLRLEGLFVELEEASSLEYSSYERIALRQLFKKLTSRLG
jgi:hypothetical protein